MKYIYTLLFVTLTYSSFAQKMPDYGLHKIRITDTSKTIQAEVIPVSSEPAISSSLTYYWYAANKIHALQGGYSGQLLNGSYTEFFLNKNLEAQGIFRKGLKDGIWKAWNEQGALLSEVNWDNGIRSGRFSFYNADGSLKQTGNYRQNEFNGAVIIHEGRDSVRTEYYKNGQLLKGKPASILNRINIFKKKKKTDQPHA
ncbi:toxin-antitoxin system YwqK family antitoxin [Mucilaginibacter sp. FT3.2]|uniref:toxin-antitoxin system YwqK family antitoxin n=1 Tax=Mucilaginibacter sp. FT3.2 TaxID=2723090 RepID=UPI0016224622|nr:hypothetical protein [Mucilaginibacter sp. FT3.2]MBB6235279.1 antitoxin component YwqK of YwqJK toxin-antitoxin module [Mucilaginibacter sp. FT3.2]